MSTPERRAAAFLSGITYLRIVLVPAVMWLILAGYRLRYAYVIGGIVFAIAAITDFFDGRLARRWKQTSTLGSFLDTTADKLLVSGALVALVAVDRASTWIAFLIIGREILVMGLRGAIAADGAVMKPSIWGKTKAAVQFGAIFLAIVRTSGKVGPLYPDQYVMFLAGILTIGSAVDYIARFSGVLSRTRERR
ncbi:MAG: CDP-diacylglycerol---glycerol-3-phosphate 3-phosphatidyltransferase [Actinomycetota bacterium]|nr:CDP-diacylglycerol---glycerol-3-phosphate 3-phosphatidyltransferase [Actinomycetota bacterium]